MEPCARRCRRPIDCVSDPQRHVLPRSDDVHVYGPVRDSGASVDSPARVDAVVGVENPDDRGITIGEGDLTWSKIVDQVHSDTEQFIITNAGETGAERQMLKIGAVWLGLGLLFLAVSAVVLIG